MGNLKIKIMNMTVLSAFLTGSAWAADKEISLDTGILGGSSPSWNMVGGNPMATIGLSGGVDIAPGLTAIASAQWSLSGSHNEFGNQWWDDGPEGQTASPPGSEGYIAALRVIQVQGGVRSDILQNSWIRPYGAAKVSASLGSLRLDDDPEDKDNVNQIKATGLSIGGIAAVGAAVERPRKQAGPFAIRGEVEAGYGFGTALKFDEIGELGMNGIHMRMGVGLRF
jgi:hypothetical protein